MNFEERIELLNEIIKESDNIVFFGGAGVSTASGIPDFRSKNGLYNDVDDEFKDYQPEYLLSADCFENDRAIFYKFLRKKLDCREYQPNIVHYKLAELEEKGKLKSVITQNIDSLHQKAGSKNVYEIHGTLRDVYCDHCGMKFSEDFLYESEAPLPECPKCGFHGIRPNIVLYQEALPKNELWYSIQDIKSADTLIVAGTSLKVQPAASLIRYFRGKNLIIINKERTMYDKVATLVFNESMDQVFERIEVNQKIK